MASTNPKIKQVLVGETTHDIDLPSTAEPSITSLTTSGDVNVGDEVIIKNKVHLVYNETNDCLDFIFN